MRSFDKLRRLQLHLECTGLHQTPVNESGVFWATVLLGVHFTSLTHLAIRCLSYIFTLTMNINIFLKCLSSQDTK